MADTRSDSCLLNVNYLAYGFVLRSSRPIAAFHSLVPDASRFDVDIQIGEAPSWVTQALSLTAVPLETGRSRAPRAGQFSLAERGPGFFELTYGDGTRFVVDREGARVWGQPGPSLTYEDTLVYLLGPVMGFVLRRRNCLALHASAVAFGKKAIAIAGPAGSGKSTTAAALALRGRPVLCEDICRIEENQIYPGYPRVCLWPDSVGFLYPSSDALPLIVEGWEKRYLPLDGTSGRFADTRLPLAGIYLLGAREERRSAVEIRPMTPREAALELVQNTYMNWLIDRDQRAAEFDAICKLVTAVGCFRVAPSADPALLAELAERIEAHALAGQSCAQPGTRPETAACDV
ncbi:MAG TPA: hypothetical protein VKB24_03775 [Candidatus Acidoferrum sp.]|nr:hypothetical protein [Candidatus Acidoferrum sp.]